MIFKLAWRNIWRNKRRSIISIASVLFAVTIALMMRSMQLGFYARTIDNVVSFYTGYLQVHAPGYEEKKSLDKSFADSGELATRIEGINKVTFTAPRLESFALISAGDITDGSQVIGIDPEREDQLTGLSNKVEDGRYLNAGDNGILLGSGLAKHMKIGVGDTVVVISSGYHGVSAAGRYPVIGTVTFPTPELNSTMAYLDLPEARWFYGATNRLTSLAIMIEGERFLNQVETQVTAMLGDDYEVVSWEDIMPEMVEYIAMDNASGVLMLILIYVIVGFGVLGTVLMMTMERMREFGVLVAVGMQKSVLRGIVLLESVILSINGAILGIVLALPSLIWLRANPIHLTGAGADALISYGFEPILPFSMAPEIFFWQTFTVLLIALTASAYPLFRITKLNSVDAMRTGN
ncbi:FtsX-like permease family protein [bacterium]|nr:FtsX-like permease family protein [bacterium]